MVALVDDLRPGPDGSYGPHRCTVVFARRRVAGDRLGFEGRADTSGVSPATLADRQAAGALTATHLRDRASLTFRAHVFAAERLIRSDTRLQVSLREPAECTVPRPGGFVVRRTCKRVSAGSVWLRRGGGIEDVSSLVEAHAARAGVRDRGRECASGALKARGRCGPAGRRCRRGGGVGACRVVDAATGHRECRAAVATAEAPAQPSGGGVAGVVLVADGFDDGEDGGSFFGGHAVDGFERVAQLALWGASVVAEDEVVEGDAEDGGEAGEDVVP